MGRRATETYCRDETDPIKHSRGLDFVTECWFCVIYPMGPMGPHGPHGPHGAHGARGAHGPGGRAGGPVARGAVAASRESIFRNLT